MKKVLYPPGLLDYCLPLFLPFLLLITGFILGQYLEIHLTPPSPSPNQHGHL